MIPLFSGIYLTAQHPILSLLIMTPTFRQMRIIYETYLSSIARKLSSLYIEKCPLLLQEKVLAVETESSDLNLSCE